MNIHESAEDYLERILILHEQNEKVIALDIANSFGYSKASVSRAMKNLRENDYITVSTNGNIELTEKGTEIAQEVIHKHRTLCDFFTKILKISQDEAEINACRIEHVITQTAFDKIFEMVNSED